MDEVNDLGDAAPADAATPAAPTSPTSPTSPTKPVVDEVVTHGTEALKAFAHPLRMAIYDYLSVHGPATATQIGRHLGESSGQTSYHLRQLARHGIVEDDPEHTGGRERWWRPVSVRFEAADEMFGTAAGARTLSVLMQGLIADRTRVLSAWAQEGMSDPAWRGATDVTRASKEMTPDELRVLIEEVEILVRAHLQQADQRIERGETEGRRPVRIYFDALPLARSLVLDDDGPRPGSGSAG
ncbi:MAG TPA: helix-turn-helix domain-containing protein [Cellulomonas sp.]